ncbi:Hypothetical predicted protein [Octopus vulgaris]|uniref:Uncharacterized protein n=1 Tax=Octopus vulgaris TaxID=6645 RepID=A0AA36B1U1_OCTVU|nr:Hypothetical predicted protein [Octopus vulgaris]
MIPAGMTSHLQTLDIAINKPFKDHLRMEINDYIENRMAEFAKTTLKEFVKEWSVCGEDAEVTKYLLNGFLGKYFLP